MATLDGVRIKLARADRHIAELRTAAQEFFDSKPYTIYEVEEANGDLVRRLRIVRTIPNDWPAVLGDAIHNLRSALEFLAWQLVERNNSTPARHTGFPIVDSKKELGLGLISKLAGASPASVRMVRRLKPYKGGNSLLHQIHSLDIVDKHRLILIVGAANKALVLKFHMKIPGQDQLYAFPPLAMEPSDRQFPLTDGVEVFRIMAAARKDDPLTKSEHKIVFELAFGDVDEVKSLPLIETLEAMHKHTSRIVEMSHRLFFV